MRLTLTLRLMGRVPCPIMCQCRDPGTKKNYLTSHQPQAPRRSAFITEVFTSTYLSCQSYPSSHSIRSGLFYILGQLNAFISARLRDPPTLTCFPVKCLTFTFIQITYTFSNWLSSLFCFLNVLFLSTFLNYFELNLACFYFSDKDGRKRECFSPKKVRC